MSNPVQGSGFSRRQALVHSERVTIKESAYAAMERAYHKASSEGRYPAHARQIMYAARGPIQEETGRQLDDQYFCQTLLLLNCSYFLSDCRIIIEKNLQTIFYFFKFFGCAL